MCLKEIRDEHYWLFEFFQSWSEEVKHKRLHIPSRSCWKEKRFFFHNLKKGKKSNVSTTFQRICRFNVRISCPVKKKKKKRDKREMWQQWSASVHVLTQRKNEEMRLYQKTQSSRPCEKRLSKVDVENHLFLSFKYFFSFSSFYGFRMVRSCWNHMWRGSRSSNRSAYCRPRLRRHGGERERKRARWCSG